MCLSGCRQGVDPADEFLRVQRRFYKSARGGGIRLRQRAIRFLVLQKGFLADARHHDDRNAFQSGIFLDVPVKLKPILVGHHDIKDDQSRPFPLGFAQAVLAVARRNGCVPAAPEEIAEKKPLVGFVVDDQNLDGLFHVPPSAKPPFGANTRAWNVPRARMLNFF